ncbi:hypothetical protein SAG0176_01905 [Streptococcus agalactiae LDS 623]|nr:hypothetical protein SAG0181_05470 [Streptococcus agalactiae LDS 628]EPX12319.1 hypothetical protein SAG0176_01905 [Streptococcus agalactiae LDS 623]
MSRLNKEMIVISREGYESLVNFKKAILEVSNEERDMEG